MALEIQMTKAMSVAGPGETQRQDIVAGLLGLSSHEVEEFNHISLAEYNMSQIMIMRDPPYTHTPNKKESWQQPPAALAA